MYYALMTGVGGGCDYTIGCNKVFKELKATDPLGLMKEVIELFDYYGGEERVKEIKVLTVSSIELFDLNSLIQSRKEDALQEQRAEKEKKEYERLKEKFKEG